MFFKKDKGFTLIEVLVTVSIFAIVAVALSSTFSGGLSVWKREKDLNRAGVSTRLAMEKMTKDFRNILTFSSFKTSGNKTVLNFPSYIKTFSDNTFKGKMGIVSYFFSISEKTLYKNEFDYSTNISDLNFSGKKIVEKIENFGFSYYLFNTETESYMWVEDFSGKEENTILAGIKIDLSYFNSAKKEVTLSKKVFIPTGRVL